MGFMEPQIELGQWYEIDGPCGTEWVPADLVGSVTIERPDGSRTVKPATLDELKEYDRAMGLTQESEGEEDNVRFPIPSLLTDYCENTEAWSIKLAKGWGARLSAPGFLDCTEWVVFDSEEEAEEYLKHTYGDDDEEEDDDGEPDLP